MVKRSNMNTFTLAGLHGYLAVMRKKQFQSHIMTPYSLIALLIYTDLMKASLEPVYLNLLYLMR